MKRRNSLNNFKFKDGTYKTVTRNVALLSRTLPSIVFYSRVLSIVYKSSVLAKRGEYDTEKWSDSSIRVTRMLEAVGVDIEITGADNFIKLNEACLFVSNHMSTLETFVLPGIIAPFRDLTFVVKKSLVEYPIFRHVMRSRDPVTVGRANPRDDLKAVLEGGSERLKNGISIVVFPQTTRATVFDPEAFNTIGIKLAKRANVPVIPVALKTDAWRNGRLIKDFGRIDTTRKVYFSFGAPIRIEGRGAEEHERIIAFITGKLDEWNK
jgi:1-acyl-sn-glycerol-3-phosphate acyltransferase